MRRMNWVNCVPYLLLSLSYACTHSAASAQPLGRSAASAAQVRQQLQALYNQSASAAMHNDMKAYGRADAPDFFIIHADGTTMTKAQMDQRAASLGASFSAAQGGQSLSPRVVGMTETIQNIALQDAGRRAVVRVKLHMVAILRVAQEKHTTVIDETSLDTWVKAPAGWLRKSSREVANKFE